MKTLLDLVGEWRARYRGTGGGPAQDILDKCADDLERWVAELAAEMNLTEAGANNDSLLAELTRLKNDYLRKLLGVKKA